jgi:hypothetical protein
VPLCPHVLLCALCRCVHMFSFVLCAVVSTCFAVRFVPLCPHVLLCALCRCVHKFCFVFLTSYYGEAKTSR